MQAEAGDVVHAGFLRRWAAIFLDQLVLTGALYLLMFVAFLVAGAAAGFRFGDGDEPPPWLVAGYVATLGLYYVVAGLYYSLLESSASQATLGKMALGIKVTDLHGARLSWPHAIARWFAAGLSYLTLYVGFLVAAFTERKQALHDLVAKTLVVDKWAYTEFPERQQRGLNGCLIAFLVFIVLMGAIAVLGILAAIAIPAYQDYTVRARANGAMHALRPAMDNMQAFGTCTPEDIEQYRGLVRSGELLDRVEFDRLHNGACQVTGWLPAGPGGVTSYYLALQFDPAASRWDCVTNLAGPQVPPTCR